MRTIQNISFKSVLAVLPRNEPLSTRYLVDCGLSESRVSYLSRHGWLTKLGRGVYMLPGDTLGRDGCLAFLAARIAGFHVGGKTALAWHGVRQNLMIKERLSLWGNVSVRLPMWFAERFDSDYQTTRLFDQDVPPLLGLAALPTGRSDLMVSSPERAILELLSDAGKFLTLEETRNLVESARNFRMSLFADLLGHVTRVKVVRLASALANEYGLPWASLAREHSERVGGADRWIAVGKTGDRLDLRRTWTKTQCG